MSNPSLAPFASLALFATLTAAPLSARQLTVELDADAILDWQVQVSGQQLAPDTCVALTESGGRVFALRKGSFQIPGLPDSPFALSAYDGGTGTELWTSIEFGQTPGFVPQRIAASANGASLFLAGAYGLHTGVIRMDPSNGALDWIALDFAPVGSFAGVQDLATTASGSRVAVSITYNQSPNNQVQTLLLDGASGGMLWSDVLDDPVLQQEKADQVVVDEARGRVLAVYSGLGAAAQKLTVVRGFDLTSGATVWTDAYPTTGVAAPRDLAFDPVQGRLFLALTGDLNVVRVYDTPTGAVLANLVTTLKTTHVAVQPGGAQVAVLGEGPGLERVQAFDVALGTSAWIGLLDPGNPGQFLRTKGLAYSQDGTRLLAGFEADFQAFPGAPKQELMAAGFETTAGGLLWVHAEDKTTSTGGNVGEALGLETPLGSRLVLCTELDTGASLDLRFVALDAGNGALGWEKTEGSLTSQGSDSFVDVALNPNQTVAFAIGAEADPAASASTLRARAFDAATGAELWSVALPGFASDHAHVLAGPLGNVVYVGSGFTQFGAAALDASTGTVLWLRTWDGPGGFGDVSRAFGLSAAGDRLFVAGASRYFDFTTLTDDDRAVVFALDSATGAELWKDDYTSDTSQEADALDLALSSDGMRVFLTGETDNQMFTRAYTTATGATLWTTLFDFAAAFGAGPGFNSGSTLSTDPAGQFVLASGRGWAAPFGAGNQLVTVAMDANTGALLWFTPSTQTGLLNMALLDVEGTSSADGSRLFLSASVVVGAPQATQFLLRCLDTATGAVLFEHVTTTGVADLVEDLVLSPDGTRLYASNNTFLGVLPQGWTDGQMVTCYDSATGAEYWSAQHLGDSAFDDQAGGLAVADDFVLVAGTNHLLASADDGFLTRYHDQALIGGPGQMSVANGGAHQLQLAAPASSAGDLYLVLGSLSGTAPGLPVQGQTLPLNFDGYLMLMLTAPNSAIHLGTFGLLDATGRGHAMVALPAGLSPAFAGLTVHHAYLVFSSQGAVSFTSNPSSLELVP